MWWDFFPLLTMHFSQLKLKKRECTDIILPLVKGCINKASMSSKFVNKKPKPLELWKICNEDQKSLRHHRLRRSDHYSGKCPPPLRLFPSCVPAFVNRNFKSRNFALQGSLSISRIFGSIQQNQQLTLLSWWLEGRERAWLVHNTNNNNNILNINNISYPEYKQYQ